MLTKFISRNKKSKLLSEHIKKRFISLLKVCLISHLSVEYKLIHNLILHLYTVARYGEINILYITNVLWK